MKLNDFQQLKQLKNNSVFQKPNTKKFSNNSKYRGKRYMKYEQDKYTPYQNHLYKRALFGLKVYNEDELKKMNPRKKRRIRKVQKRAQSIINVFKQERVNKICSDFCSTFFSNSTTAKHFLCSSECTMDPKFINILDLKSLNISKDDIVKRLIKEGVLPQDFYDLKKNT